MFYYLGDSKTFALEAIRRFMKAALDKEISRSAFWERLAGDRLKNYLRHVVAELIVTLTSPITRGGQLLKQLGVTDIWLLKLFANEMYDPNYKKRETSLMRINRLLSEGEV